MRIGIDVRPYQVTHKGRGIGYYTIQLIRHLAQIDNNNEYLLFHESEDGSNLNLKKENFIPKPLILPKRKMPKGFNLLWNQFQFPRVVEKERLDLFHFCDLNIPFRKVCPTVVTIHDLTPLILPEMVNFRAGERMVYKFRLKCAQRAERIIADSENTKKDIIKLLKVDEEKVKVVYLARDSRFHPIEDRDILDEIRKKYHLKESFILYVGGLSGETKNIKRLIKAFARLLKMSETKYDLVIVGEYKGNYYQPYFKSLQRVIREHSLEGKVIFVGFIPEEDLLSLYNAAELFVFPSLYEGFGIPPLEAMACGTPVVTSNTSSLPEVVGDAALLFDPYKVKEITSAIQKVLTDNHLRQNLIAKGLEQVRKFSWEKTARETLEVYEEVTQS